MSARDTSSDRHRSRWAALGAAAAVTLGAGGLSFVDAAAGSGERATFTAIPSCRVVDTRPDFQVGDRSTPLGANETMTVSVRGTAGQCDGLPDDGVAIALNVTALGATAPTFLTFWPGGELPNASSLNPAPGQPPTPNAVTVDLSDDGTFDVYNFAGSVDVVIDVVGHYRDHHHDDRYHAKTYIDDALAQVGTSLDKKADAATTYTKTQVDATIAGVQASLDDKADAATTYTKTQVDATIVGVEASLDDKADAATTYTKTQVDSAIASATSGAAPYISAASASSTTVASADTDTVIVSQLFGSTTAGTLKIDYSASVAGVTTDEILWLCAVGPITSIQSAPGTIATSTMPGQDWSSVSGTATFDIAAGAPGSVTLYRLMCRNDWGNRLVLYPTMTLTFVPD